jgi:protein-disulfide isomerase
MAQHRASVVADVTLALCAVGLVAWVMLRDRVAEREASPGSRPVRDSVPNTEDLRAVGREVGNPNASLQIIEFLDLECAACALYHEKVIRELLRGDDGGEVSLVYVHFPLRSHRNAVAAAHASECAAEQGRFGAFVDHALNAQGRFASAPWNELASAAGVSDLATYQSCVGRDSVASRVDAGRRVGDALGVTGTPTLVVNGWRYRAPPTLDEIRRQRPGAPASDVRRVR